MVTRGFGSLSPAARQAIPSIEAGLSRGLSGNAILNSLRAANVGIRRRDMQQIVRNLRGQEQSGLRVRNIRKGLRPDPARITQSTTGRMRTEFAFKVRVDGLDKFGNKKRIHTTVSTDRLLTRGEIEAQALEDINADLEQYEIEAEQITILTAVRKGGPFEIGV